MEFWLVLMLYLFNVRDGYAIFVNPDAKNAIEGPSGLSGRVEEAQLADHEVAATGRPYLGPGRWATAPPHLGTAIGFTPIQSYTSVRRTNSVQHLPRSEAYKEALSPDELRNSHRLKEVLRTKKIQEVYSEEGYEDTAYDHGSQERFAEYDENFEKHKKGKHRGSVKHSKENDTNIAESHVNENVSKIKKKPNEKINRKKVETKNVSFAYDDDAAKKHHFKGTIFPTSHEKRDFSPENANFWDLTDNWKPTINKWDNEFFNKQRGNFEDTNGADAMPTFRYIHSLTDAHYGHQSPTPHRQHKAIPENFVTMSKQHSPLSKSIPYQPKKSERRVKRDDGEQKSTDYEKELKLMLDEQRDKIVSSALSNVRISELLEKDNPSVKPTPVKAKLSWIGLDFDPLKYPYYYSPNIDPFSPLKYASHPRLFPKKSGSAMEFYDSRDRMIKCDDITVSLEDVPNDNSTDAAKSGNKKRIVGLGEKIKCMKIKYFGEDPLDSPFFKEGDKSTIMSYNSRNDLYSGQKDAIVEEPGLKVNDSDSEGSQQEVSYEVVHSAPVKVANKTVERVIPVREFFGKETKIASYPEITTPAPIRGMMPPPYTLPYLPLSIITIPRVAKPVRQMRTIKYKYNCLQPVTRMTVSERSDDEDIMFDCQDVTMIQTLRNGNQHFKIIPKKIKRSSMSEFHETGPIRSGEVLEVHEARGRMKRSEDPNSRRRSQLFPNRALLDKMTKRQTVFRRKNDTTTSTPQPAKESPKVSTTTEKSRSAGTTVRALRPKSTSTTTVAPTSTIETSPKLMPKKPMARLSGIDFLTRYHKSKNTRNKNGADSTDFWKPPPPSTKKRDLVSSGTQNIQKRWMAETEVIEPVLTGASFMRRSDSFDRGMRRSWGPVAEKPPALLYIVNTQTGIGKWITQPTSSPNTSLSFRGAGRSSNFNTHRYLNN